MRLPVLALKKCAITLLLAACSSRTTNNESTFNADANLTTTSLNADVAAPPAHRYAFKEGLTYGYISAVSEEDQKKGKATGDVVMYTYHGNQGGVYKLISVDASGRELGRFECTNPCVAIKSFIGGRVGRIAFSPDSVIGSAFTDAIGGQLEPVHLSGSRTSPFLPSAWAGDYNGTFDGNASGSVTIKDVPTGVRVTIGVGAPNCSGQIEFIASRPADHSIVHTMPDDHIYGRCTIRLSRDGPNLSVRESNCLSYHGAECSFDGQASMSMN